MLKRNLWAITVILYAFGCNNSTQELENDLKTEEGIVPLSKAVSTAEDIFTGEATRYIYEGNGSCILPEEKEVYTAAMNSVQYNTAEMCGACVEVMNKNNNKSIVVRIDDECPPCGVESIDLSEEAFAKIADPKEEGRIPIDWRFVSCPLDEAIYVVFKEGSSQWWTGVQIRNHRNTIVKLEYRSAGAGKFVSVKRQNYNYFIKADGMGRGPYDFRITDLYGEVLVLENIPLSLKEPIRVEKQFEMVASGKDDFLEPDIDGRESRSVINYDPNAIYAGLSFYSDYVVEKGSCLLPVAPEGLYSVAINSSQYSSSEVCGACIEVMNTENKRKVVARIDNQCTTCGEGDISLAKDGFEEIASVYEGNVPVEWHFVPCPLQEAMSLYFKDGTHEWWKEVQVRGHKNPIAEIMYQPAPDAEFRVLKRTNFNYFVTSSQSAETGPFALKITDVYGNTVIVEDIPLKAKEEIPTGKQF